MDYDLSGSLGAESAVKAFKMANRKRMYKGDPLIHHSDRGLQYCSNKYQKILKKNKITPSMTESHDPFVNAIAERVNGILKQDFYKRTLIDQTTMKLLVDDAIDIYNRIRPHYSCYMKTPEQMHLQRSIKIRNYKKIR